MITTFTVDRATWLRGEGCDASSLLRTGDGKMCCLGFLALACGVPSDAIENVASPSAMITEFREQLPAPIQDPSADAPVMRLMSVNDDEETTDVIRERLLTKVFSEIGIQVAFTGESKQQDP